MTRAQNEKAAIRAAYTAGRVNAYETTITILKVANPEAVPTLEGALKVAREEAAKALEALPT